MSETTNLKLFKHDNPETNEEQFDIGNYLNGNWDKIDENVEEVNTEISNIKTEKTELEKELKEMQEDYYQTSIRGQASGEYIHVEDSSGARCKIGISGNSEQETRSGKNLFKPLNITSNGITTTYDKDGVGTIKGTSTNMWANISANVIYLYPAGNYVLSIDEPKTFNINLKGIYTDEEIFEFVIPAGSKTKNVAFKKEVYSMYAFISGFAAGTTLDDTIKIQLEKGSTATDFEQYGLMPSPNYLSEIKTVGSNVNLFDKDTNILVNSSESRVRTDYILLKKGTYTLNFIGADSFYLMIFNENKVKSKETDWTEKNSSFELDNKYYVVIIFRKNNNIALNKDEVVNIKLVEGTEVGEYSKYGQGSVKLTKCNKNLSKYKTFTSTSSARVVGDTTTSGQQIEGIKIKKGKTYTVSFDVVSLPSSDYRIQIRESTDESVAQTNGEIPNSIQNEPLICNTLTRHSKTITAQGDNYLYIRCIPNGFVLDNIQVEEKETSTHYEQHEEQSYIMPVQKEMLQEDYFDFDNEEEVHVWGNVVANGTETINKNSNSEFFSITKSMSQFDTSANAIKQSISNYGTGTTLALGSGNTNNKYSFDASTIYLDCYNSNINTVEKLKVQLTKSNMKIYTKLSTPTRLKFTDEQKAVAKELNNARTYKNVTNITTDSKAILSLDYVKDQETQNQKMQNEIDEIKQLLSTTQTSAMLLDNLQKEVESEVE